MAIKYTIEGLLIYMALAAYLAAFVASVFRPAKSGRILFFSGFLFSAVAFLYRWHNVHHIPLQNLFEVFLALGMLVYPLSLFSKRFLAVSGEAVDSLIAAILLVLPGFVFSAEPQKLPPALQSWLFAPHVAAYMFSYVIMAKAAVQAFRQLYRSGISDEQKISFEEGIYRMVCLGFPLMTLGLLLGSWWGKLAWGDYWSWDPKELWSLAAWLVYIGYFHLRYGTGGKYPRINSLLVILGLVFIVITLLWVNLSRLFPGLHTYAT